MKLDELLRRHDVCFFCGYTIGIAGQTKCPECGKERPTAEEIARVRRAIKVGKAGVIVFLAALLLLAGYVTYSLLSPVPLDPFGVVWAIIYNLMFAAWAACVLPWTDMARRTPLLFRSAWRSHFLRLYPWTLLLSLVAFITWVWLTWL